MVVGGCLGRAADPGAHMEAEITRCRHMYSESLLVTQVHVHRSHGRG